MSEKEIYYALKKEKDFIRGTQAFEHEGKKDCYIVICRVRKN